MPQHPPHPKEWGRYFALAQVGLEMVAPLALGVILDIYLGWAPWGTIAGAVFGLVAGVTHLVALGNRQDKDRSPPQPREGP